MTPELTLSDKKLYILDTHPSRSKSLLDYSLNLAAFLKTSASLWTLKNSMRLGEEILSPLGQNEEKIENPTPALTTYSSLPDTLSLGQENSKYWEKALFDMGKEASLEDIIHLIEKEQPYLLLVEGIAQQTLFQQWFGTFETQLAKATDIPVLIVPPHSTWTQVDQLLFIIDNENFQVKHLELLNSIAMKLQAKLVLVLISADEIGQDSGDFLALQEKVKQHVPDVHITTHKIYAEKKATEVQDLVQATRADWLVFEKKNKSFLERLFSDYNSHKLILDSHIPTLVF